MRLRRLLTGAIAAVVAACALGSTSLSAQSAVAPAAKAVPAASEKIASTPVFATLKGVKAVPMESRELHAVKGLHVHFLDAGGQTVLPHLAGDIKTENNWENLGGSDGHIVAQSYNGLCIAAGISATGGISIPGAAVQCPH
jgi:hypothetical protein